MLFQAPYPNNLPLAEEGSRMINFFIDLIISTTISLVVMKTLILPYLDLDAFIAIVYLQLYVIFTGIRVIYYFIFEAFLGGTIGQRLTKSHIVTLNKETPKVRQFFIRAISRPLTGAGSFISDDIQAFHDKTSNTYVITKNDQQSLEDL